MPPSEKAAAAEKILAAVYRYDELARETGPRDGSAWAPIRESVRKKLLDVQLERLRMLVDGGEWERSFEYASRLSRSYKS